MRILFKFISLCLLSLFITGCGFQLREANYLPINTRLMYLKSPDPYGRFINKLKKTFYALGVNLTDTQQQAPITFEILANQLGVAQSSIGTSSQSTIYIVTYRASFRLTDHKNSPLTPPYLVSSSANLILNAGQLIDSNNQLILLENQLQQDVITKIIAILGSPQVKAALAHPSHENYTRATSKKSK